MAWDVLAEVFAGQSKGLGWPTVGSTLGTPDLNIGPLTPLCWQTTAAPGGQNKKKTSTNGYCPASKCTASLQMVSQTLKQHHKHNNFMFGTTWKDL